MKKDLESCIELLSRLIAFQTQNPGGDELPICSFLAEELRRRGADHVELVERPRERGGVRTRGAYVFARWGRPSTVINVHVDTVPVSGEWTQDPFTATVSEDRVTGLGATDNKGAIASVLTALDDAPIRELGVLFSGDEEAGGSVLPHFLESAEARPIERAVVCEPTRHRVGVRHRGLRAYRAEVEGEGGHSSSADSLPKPVVGLARLAVDLDALGQRYLDHGPEDMKGLCMNVARLGGGSAFNVVPERASLVWSLRPAPGFDAAMLDEEIGHCVEAAGEGIAWSLTMEKPAFATRDVDSFRPLFGDRVEGYEPLQFWTEASTFSRAGIDAVVVGPGDIAQAHTANEFVLQRDLEWGIDLFRHLLQVLRDDAGE